MLQGVADEDRYWVLWDDARVVWEGLSFRLRAPLYIDAPAAAWLQEMLPGRLASVLDANRPYVRVDAAWGNAEGLLTIGGLHPPWPQVAELHKVIADAVDEAYQEASDAHQIAADFEADVRATLN